MKVKLKIKGKILLLILTASTLLYSISIGYILVRSRKIMIEDSIDNAKLVAENSAQKIQLFFERDLSLARTLAKGLSAFNKLDTTTWQQFFTSMYIPIVENNPHIYTLWDSWELYSYIPGYNKTYGRFCITVYRENDIIRNAMERRSLTGDPEVYAEFKKNNVEDIFEPYLDEVLKEDKRRLMTTVAAPIQQDGKYIGIIGVDITLEYLQKLLENIKPHEGSYAFLVSAKGVIAAHPDTSLIFKNLIDEYPDEVKTYKLLDIIKNEKETYYIHSKGDNEDYLTVFEPVKVGNSRSTWSLAYSVPMKVINDKANKSIIISFIVGFVGLLIMVLIVVFVSNSLTRPISLITKTLGRLSLGEINEDMALSLYTGDEIEEMANALNYSIRGLANKSHFATKIGQGDYTTQLELLSDNDELGKSLIEMQGSLVKAREEEKNRQEEERKRVWANDGIALFGDILHKSSDNQDNLLRELLKNFVKYLNANQGAIYLLNNDNEEEKYLEMVKAYAWDRQKSASGKILIGEGLVGACFHEEQTIFLTQVPDDYIKIGSGLGDANPTSIVIVPLKYEAGSLGVLELASFNVFTDYQIEFLEKVCQNVASTLSVVKINEQTRILLEKSQEQAEQMQSQEEEMRQNMEELLATQEEMARKEIEMESRMNAINGLVLMMEYDFNGIIISANSKLRSITGHSSEDLIGKHHSILFDNKDYASKESYKKFWETMHSGKSYEGLLKRKTSTNKIIAIKAFAHPVFDSNGLPSKVIEIGVEVNEFLNANK
ncbi:MAG TPA: cache domain-containing protein [Salinivirgaceae bacterium]|nr:cache domain-containing protein [Salinivirgaceae bacterium]HQA75829.1 cache domain-containing protein [Salinivirgaceae bacterium]